MIYFVEAPYRRGVAVKIGFAATFESLDARVHVLQIANPHRLHLVAVAPGTLEDEVELHRRHARSRIRGEWFRLTDVLRAEMRRAQEADWHSSRYPSSRRRLEDGPILPVSLPGA